MPLGGVEGWFRAALAKCDPRVEVKTVRASAPDWEKEVGWADAVMISGSPRDAFADDEWTHGLMAKVARLLEKKKPVLGVCYGHQILGRVQGGKVERCEGGWELGETKVETTAEVGVFCITHPETNEAVVIHMMTQDSLDHIMRHLVGEVLSQVNSMLAPAESQPDMN